MIRILKESFNNFPSWLKKFLTDKHGARWVKNDLNKLGVDLANANVEEVTSSKDPRLSDPNYIVFVDLTSSAGRLSNNVLIYRKRPLSNGYEIISDVDIEVPGSYKDKSASKMSNRTLLGMADHFAVLDLKANSKPKRQHYNDPRVDRHGKRGQYYSEPWTGYNGEEHPGKWITPQGRDKSGYAIPDPAKLVGKLYEFDLDNTAQVLDNYYKKIQRIKNQLFNIDFRNMKDSGIDSWGHDYPNLMRTFGDVARYFTDLEREVNEVLQASKDKDWDKYFDKYPEMTKDKWFQDRLGWISAKRDLDDLLYDIQSKLKKVNS